MNWGLGFVEVYDARQMPDGWTATEFDDSAWDAVQVLSVGGGPPDTIFGGMKIEPFPTLLPREIPFLDESPLAPAARRRVVRCSPHPELPVDRRLYEEPLQPLPPGSSTARTRCCMPMTVRPRSARREDHDVSFLLDFGRIHSGYPFIELEARGGEVIEVAVAEGMPGRLGR